ncbi:MAG: helix-turn-helix transcriptional regulator [Thermoleophilia bacterium]|nr:helix-turn-helix transcriptional regulator [Thermoleophilia bacterium]
MKITGHASKAHESLIAEEMARDSVFREEWEGTALARLVAAQLIAYRHDHGLSQTSLGERLGMKQPQVARLEAGEKNPQLETLVRISAVTGVEFVIDIAPTARKPRLVTRRVASEHRTRDRDGVSVVLAAAS